MCSKGFWGAGCTTPTSTVSVLTNQINVLEPLVGTPSDRSVLVSLMRTPSTVEPTSISFAVQTESGNATAGSDYDILPPFNNVTWINATHGYLTLRLKVYHDTIYEPVEIFTGKLQYDADVYQDSTLAGNLYMQFSISDGPPGTAQFAVSEYRVSEAANDALIKLERVGGVVGTMAVTVVLVSATTTAQAGDDYTFERATITWEDGDSNPKAIAVPLRNDKEFESDERIVLRIDHVTHYDMRGSALQEISIVVPAIPCPTTLLVGRCVGMQRAVTYNFTKNAISCPERLLPAETSVDCEYLPVEEAAVYIMQVLATAAILAFIAVFLMVLLLRKEKAVRYGQMTLLCVMAVGAVVTYRHLNLCWTDPHRSVRIG